MNPITTTPSGRVAGRAPAPYLVICLGLLLAGCSNDMTDLVDYMVEVRSRTVPPPKDIPPPPPPPERVQVSKAVDPFRPFATEEQGPEILTPDPPLPSHNPEELEAFPLDVLRMVGTIEHGGELSALVRDPHGIVHRIKQGHYMGMNYGHVVLVAESGIELKELVPDNRGGWEERDAGIALTE